LQARITTTMLSAFRTFAGTWPARIFFLILVVSFASWGVADVVRNVFTGSSGAVATVDGQDITPQQFMAEYQQNMRRAAERLQNPAQVPAALREQVARQALERLVTQAALSAAVHRMGVVAPDEAVRQAVFAMAEFQGPGGTFDRNMLLQVLSSNNITEARFTELVRQDVAQNQLLQTVGALAGEPPALLTDMVFRYMGERRRADLLSLPFAGRPLPAPPADAVLRRFYDNNPGRSTTPEYRHIKAVILSPDSIGRGLDLPDADLRAWFTQHRADYVAPEKRSIQVITTGSAQVAAALAAQWKAGAGWEAMQEAAKKAGATAVPLDDAAQAEMPSPELARAAFAARQGEVVGPIVEPLGTYVLRVSGITPARNPTFESLRETVRGKVAAERALDLIDARAQKLQDLFAGGAKIDEVPADLGATGAAGTLDAQGNTQDGSPAPIPAGKEARQAIIDAAFKTNPGDPIQPTEGPDHTWFAVAVDSVIKPARRPFGDVRSQVLADWQADQTRHTQEAEAARILGLVRSGQTLANAAWGSGLQVSRTAPLARGKPAAGVPAELSQTLFTLAPNEATMVETNAGFVVAQLAEIIPPDPKADSMGLTQAREGLGHALHDDYVQMYATALRDQAHPVVRPNVVQALIQQPGE
jgi:peptidyl-prolyl cis-trans isomerase D